MGQHSGSKFNVRVFKSTTLAATIVCLNYIISAVPTVGKVCCTTVHLFDAGLPLACLPTALAVYREVRDSYKTFVLSDLVVSWPGLLAAR